MLKLAIIADVHDNLINLQKALDYIDKEKIDYLISLGDLQSLEAWQMLDDLKIPVWAVMGNADKDIIGEKQLRAAVKNIHFSPNIATVELAEKKIIFGHYPEIIKKIILNYPNKYQLALAGHTHLPWEEMIGTTKVLNPGNIANIRCAPTFAIMNLDTLKAKLILLNEIQK
jgi:putative phosphoesterase